MSDYERYGDYNNLDDEESGRRHPILRMIRWFFSAALLLFVGFLVFRLFVAEYYPKAVRRWVDTPAYAAYTETHDPDREKVKISVPYDDNVRASFIADNLQIERGSGAVQFTLRLSRYTMTKLAEATGVDPIGKPDDSPFSVTLRDNLGNVYELTEKVGKNYLWYRAVRYCFDGVELGDPVGWIRVEIRLAETPDSEEPYATIPILDFSDRTSD